MTRRDVLAQAPKAAVAGALASGLVSGMSGQARAEADDSPLKSDRKIRVGIVGGGFGASFQWHEDPNCTVRAVSDLRPDRRDHLMKTYKCDKSYESLEKLILDKDIEAVAVFTGAPDHARHVLTVMNAGKHAISAVPACIQIEDAYKMKEMKEKTGLKYMMAETSYYRQNCIAARKLFQDGAFGELFYSEVEYYHPGIGAHKDGLSWWNGKKTWRYGLPPMFYPTHSTGLLIGVTGERLTDVSCLGWAPKDEIAWKDNVYNNPFGSCMALMKTDRGHMCRCGVFWDGTAHGERAQWFGTKLTYYMASSGGQPFALKGPGAPKWSDLPDFSYMLPKSMRHASGHGGSHTFLTHEFIAALVEDREPAVNLYEALAMTAPGLVAHQSALKGGEQLKVPSFDKA
ncbi:MAG: Gfo/Idh/MocA family oxidoreductase [Phycisphaerae bacterium]|nr:Gfo/Idh/MocA family oxidoreductase [Phycisphaerae bacterium]